MEYVAFVRAINVAGHGRVKMIDLKEAFTSAGCDNVRTYIQSGNVLFSTPQRDSRRIFRSVRDSLGVLLDEKPEIMFRRLEHIRQLVERNPFRDIRDADNKLYVAFLSRTPKVLPNLPISSEKEGLEVIGIEDREAFIVSRQKKNGFYGFPNNFIEEQLEVAATSRNWSTVTRISVL